MEDANFNPNNNGANAVNAANAANAIAANQNETAIVSGSDTKISSSSSDDDEINDGLSSSSECHDKPPKKEYDDDNDNDLFYSNTLDDENEAWVYKHMRGGQSETVNIRKSFKSTAATEDSPDKKRAVLETSQILKPRYSDAILSCPCCFNIVCMDCQRHERYPNQFRAMFVMNIGVDWTKQLVYDEATRQLQPRIEMAQRRRVDKVSKIPMDDCKQKDDEKEEVYYSVHCNVCSTEVAALDMEDEVYHFFGCVASG